MESTGAIEQIVRDAVEQRGFKAVIYRVVKNGRTSRRQRHDEDVSRILSVIHGAS